MVYKCCVPDCNGNYKNGPRVTVFSFPKEISLRNAWLSRINREVDYKVTVNSKVCEKHFAESDIRKEVQAFDEKNGRTITAKLTKHRLRNGAIPTILLPNCPKYLSSTSTSKRCTPEQRRKRNPPFSSEETRTLVDLMDQHRSVMFDESATDYAKDTVWTNITEAFNMKGFPHTRDETCIKMKWENLREKARIKTKNFTEIRYDEYDKLTAHVVALMTELETLTENEDENNVTESKLNIRTISIDGEDWDVIMVDDGDAADTPKQDCDRKQLPKLRRDLTGVLNFTAQECRRLAECVEAEKKIIFCKGTSVAAIRMKNNAWTRISREFNKGNVHKRSIKALKKKLENMRTQARIRVNHDAKVSEDRTRTNLPADPNNMKEECNGQMEYSSLDWEPDNILYELPQQIRDASANGDADNSDSVSSVTAVDPLAGVVSGYSDVAAKRVDSNVVRPVTDSDIMRLKAEILQCELETAKQKQSQEKEASVSEDTDRRLRAQLLALQLREARLNAWIAEQRATQAGATSDLLQYRKDERAAEDSGDGFHS